ncbi:MAG: trypsin-like peptidase domain-containing protein [bacterium]|nr:trypsin-like peptidase domain-containing protein [bacterium]
MRICSSQHIGGRESQQDRLAATARIGDSDELVTVVAGVADGMGGTPGGDRAAEQALAAAMSDAMELPEEAAPPATLLNAIASAQHAVKALGESESSLSGAGTTLALVMVTDGDLYWASVGDTSVYVLRNGELLRATEPHRAAWLASLSPTVVGRESLPGNILHSYLGSDEPLVIDRNLWPFRLAHGDRVLLATDGVSDTLARADIARLLGDSGGDPADRIVAAAAARGGDSQDNATALCLDNMPLTRGISPRRRIFWSIVAGTAVLLLFALAMALFLRLTHRPSLDLGSAVPRNPNVVWASVCLLRRNLPTRHHRRFLAAILALVFCFGLPASATANAVDERTFASTYRIVTRVRNGKDIRTVTGSGFAINSDGYIVTNWHVVPGQDVLDIRVYSRGDEARMRAALAEYRRTSDFDGEFARTKDVTKLRDDVIGPALLAITEEAADARLVWFDRSLDLALLQCSGANDHAYLKLASLKDVRPNDDVVVVGYPSGAELGSPEAMITAKADGGHARATEDSLVRDGYAYQALHFDAQLSDGSSGSPILNGCGAVVAVASYIIIAAPGAASSYGVSADHVIEACRKAGVPCEVAGPCDDRAARSRATWLIVAGVVASLALSLATLRRQRRDGRTNAVAVRDSYTSLTKRIVKPHSGLALVGCDQDGTRLFAAALEHPRIDIGSDTIVANLVVQSHARDIDGLHCVIHWAEGDTTIEVEDWWSRTGTFDPKGNRLEPGARCRVGRGESFRIARVSIALVSAAEGAADRN